MLRWQLLPKFIYRCNPISAQIPSDFSVEINKLVLQFMWNFKGPRIVKTVLKMKSKIKIHNFRTYNRATVIKTVSSWYNRHRRSMEQN